MAGNFWLVKTGLAGGAEVQNLPVVGGVGQKPPQAKWGGAVYLGPTTADVNRWIGQASNTLHVNNPQKVPDLATSAGIIGAELSGPALTIGSAIFGGASAASEVAAAETAAGAPAAETAAAGGGAAGGSAAARAARSAASSAAGSAAGKVAATAGLAGLLGLSGNSELAIRILMGMAGLALLLLGLQALTGTGSNGNPVALAKKAAKVAR